MTTTLEPRQEILMSRLYPNDAGTAYLLDVEIGTRWSTYSIEGADVASMYNEPRMPHFRRAKVEGQTAIAVYLPRQWWTLRRLA